MDSNTIKRENSDMAENEFNEQFVVLMNGWTACLKTYTSRRLSNAFKIPVLETNKFGHCVGTDGMLDDRMRTARYKSVFAVANEILKQGHSVVIDGTFNFRRWREEVYRLSSNQGIKHIVIVRCFCSDSDVIRLRISERVSNVFRPENQVSRYEDYEKTVADDETIYEDVLPNGEKPSVVAFDSGNYTVTLTQGQPEGIATKVRDVIWASVNTGKLSEH